MEGVRAYRVELCERRDVKDFIESWHYSGSINGLMCDYCFRLMDGERMVGAMIYGGLAMANAWRAYGDSKDDVLELRRLCCVDDTYRNAESYFIGRTLRWLVRHTDVSTVVSYADPEYSHVGVIYQASNFSYAGKTAKGRVIMHNGKKYHDKAIRTTYKGQLKPFALRLKQALEAGDAYYKTTAGKYIYVYDLAGRR